MERNDLLRAALAIALSVVVMFVWQAYFTPKPQPVPPAAATQAAPAAAAPAPASTPTAPAAAPGAAPPAEAIAGDPTFPPVTLRTETQEIQLSPRGGRIVSWKLLKFPAAPGDGSKGDLDLVSQEARALDKRPLVLFTGDAALDATLNEAPCKVTQREATADEIAARKLPTGTQKVEFRWADGRGLALSKDFYLAPGDDYVAHVDWSATKGGQPLEGASLWWGPSIGLPVPGGKDTIYHYRGRAKVAVGGTIREVLPDKQEGNLVFAATDGVHWVALDETYFAVALIPEQAASVAVRPVATPGPTPRGLAITSASHALTIFAGPKNEPVLRRVDERFGTDLSGIVAWGSILGVIAKPLYYVMGFFNRYIGNWGWSIVLITVLIKVLFVPLTQKSMVSMRKTQQDMARIQPRIHKLREKFKLEEAKTKDRAKRLALRQQMNTEMMELYKRENINPAASLTGCLPMLLQMPVLFAMYRVLTVSTELRGAPFFGWIHDLTAPDPYWITPLVMGATMLVQQVMSMTKTEDPQQRSQQRMMLIMPLVFLYMFLWAPSGLVVYWLVNNVLGIAQQYFINRHTAAATARA